VINWAEFFRILCHHRPGCGAMISDGGYDQDLILSEFNNDMLNSLAKHFWMVPLSDGGINSVSPLAQEWIDTTEETK